MSRPLHRRRWPGALTPIPVPAGQRWRPPLRPARSLGGGHLSADSGGHLSADICPVDQLSFWQIVHVPFGTWLAALERWQLTAADSELRLGQSLLRGPVGHDPISAPAGSRPAWPSGRCAPRYRCAWTSTTGPPPPPLWR